MGIEIVFGLLVVLIVIASVFIQRKKGGLQNSAPNLIIITGIFCTFAGISIALWDFNPNNIDNSLNHLISGIKTAFIPSAIAVLSALVWKGYFSLHGVFAKQTTLGKADESCTISDMVQAQNQMVETIKQIFENKDSLLLDQLDCIRKEISIGFRDIGEKFDRFSEKIANDNSQALIEALKEVMRDFNAKINEQFGENFKHLNDAVGKLVYWQEGYSQELDKKSVFFQKLQEQLQQQAQDYDLILQNSKYFEHYATKMYELINQYKVEQEKILNNTKILSELSNSLQANIPQIVKNIDEVNEASKNLIHGVERNYSTLMDNFNNYHQEMTSEVSKSLTSTSDQIKNQTEVLHRSLEKALNDSLSGLGSQLASLSNKFVQDYTPLTDRLRELVRVSERLS